MEYAWYPHPGPQTEFCKRNEFEVLYGGAAGGGKSDCLIMEATRYVGKAGYKGLILRRTFPQLQEIIDRTRMYYPLIGGEYKAGEHRWYFPSGASIKMGHIQNEGDEYNYQGQEYQYIAFDEACQFVPKQYLYLFSRARSTDPEIPCRVRSATNPGGIGHAFLKDRFRIGNVDPYTTITDQETGLSRVFVPAKLTDNPSLTENDPNYVARLMQLPEIERMRLLEGVWDAFEGQAFSELNMDLHGFDGELPIEWEAFGSFDWGYSKPWVYMIWRVDYDGRLWLDRMKYGCKEGQPDTGLRQTDSEIAREIKRLEEGLKIRQRFADPAIFNRRPNKKEGVLGPSVADEMVREGIVFIKADNDRVLGRQQIHHRLKVDEEGKPWMYVRNNLTDWWRTMQLMVENPNRPEDLLEKDVEDHCCDCTRYALMTRPLRPKIQTSPDTGSFQAERRKYIKAKQLAMRRGVSLAKAYGSF